MKVRYSEQVETTKEVPDHFAYDDSRLGRIVDVLLGEGRRTDLYSDEMRNVEGAIYDLEEAYGKAARILNIFGGDAR